MNAPPLRAEGLVVHLSGRRALDGVSLDLWPGQWTAIVGPNGAGKSTLLSVLAGLRRPEAGSVLLQGRTLAEWPAQQRAQRLAWLSQQGEAEGDIAARDVVRLGRLPRHGLFGSPDAIDEAAVSAAMDETHCSEFSARRLNALSGGERQRVLLARALAVGATVLLLDEPTAHLDAPHQRSLCRGLQSRASDGCTVVSVLHDINLALTADRIVLMANGRIAADGAPGAAPLHAALAEVFEEAFTIESLQSGGLSRWVVVPAP